MTMITSALAVQQSLSRTNLSVAVMKNALQADQAIAQMLMESIKSGETVTNPTGAGLVNLYV